MGQIMGPQFALIAGLVSYMWLIEMGQNGAAAIISAGIVTVVFGLAWWYSPMPHQNGGFGHPPALKQKWGFTTKPAENQPTPKGSEAFAWRPSLFGIYYAENQPEDKD